MKPTDLIEESAECSVRFRSFCKKNDIRTFSELKAMFPMLPKMKNYEKHLTSEAKDLIYEMERNIR